MTARAPVPSDLYRVVVAADPLVRAGGRSAIVRLATFDRERETIVHALWDVRAGAHVQLTGGPDDHDAALSPDGTMLAFVAGTAPSAIVLLALDDPSRARRACGPSHDSIADLAWSPQGDRIVFTALSVPDTDATIACDPRTGARHIVAFPYKDDARGLLDGGRRSLFVADVATGSVRSVVAHATDAGAPAWSPDGTRLVFAARVADACGDTASRGAVFVVDLASGDVHALTPGDGPAYRPVYSPGGDAIAYAGHRHGNDNRFNLEVFVVAASGGEPHSLTATADCAVGNALCGDVRSGSEPRVVWLPGGDAVAALVTIGGACHVVAFALDGAPARTLAGGERDISGFAIGADETLAIVYATPLEPSVVGIVAAGGREWPAASLNPWLADVALIEPHHIEVAAGDGASIDAWSMVPPAASAPAPLVLAIHPGPHAAFGWTFALEFQIVAACGIGVVYGNPRGSLGYGTAFAQAITGDWGGRDAADLLAIVDAALAHGSFDARRVACIGQSYGGFMTTWLLGHTTRFAAGVSTDAVNEFASLYAGSDVGWTMETELASDVARDAGRDLFERSALRAAREIVAPLLIVHSERDYRCPIDQAEALFNTLRYGGKRNVEFVRFAGDGHELSRSGAPHDRVLRLRAIARWLLRHLGDGTHAPGDRAAGSLFRALPGE